MSQLAFFVGMALFFGAHLFSVFRSRSETGLRARLGDGPYMGLYSLISALGFVLLAWGWSSGRPWPSVWTPPEWTRHIAIALMPIALILLVAAYAPAGYLKKAVKHPMLAGVKVWAFAHLCANGDLGGILLFGAFLVFAVIDRIALARRGDKGPVDVKPHITGDMMAIAGGLGAYIAIVFGLHKLILGLPIMG